MRLCSKWYLELEGTDVAFVRISTGKPFLEALLVHQANGALAVAGRQ